MKKVNFNKIYKNIIFYFKHNRLFLSYVLLSFLNCFLIRVLTVGNWNNIITFLIDLLITLAFGSICYLIKPEKQYKYLIVLMSINVLLCLVNAIYYGWYTSFASFSLLSTLGQAAEVSDAIFSKLKFDQLIYVIPFILFILINRSLNKKDYYRYAKKFEKGKKMFIITFICSSFFLSLSLASINKTNYSRLVKQWNREAIVKSFGIVIYQGNDLFQTVNSKVNSLFGYDEAYKNVVDFYSTKEEEISNNKYTGVFEGKNVIMVHLESMMSFFVNLEINGVEITPNLNRLTKEGLYFSNFYPEVSVGTSSDTEFTVNTSLLPVTNGTVFVSYYDRKYVSLETLLSEKGYYTFSMHGNKASMWNRNKMHPNLGYQNMYFEESYNIDDVIGLGISDSSFFEQIFPILTDIENNNTNYMGTIITLSNHTPWADVDKYPELDLSYKTVNQETNEEVVYDYLEGTKLGNYIKSTHYADMALGELLDKIENSDIMDNTIFVFYGDHDARMAKSEFNYYYNYDFTTGELKSKDDPTYVDYDYYANELNRKTPLIIWGKNTKYKREVKYYMGMIDVLPTLSNMLGIKNNYALGHDIFYTKWDNIVPFPNGNFVTNKVYYNASLEEYKPLSSDPISEDYIKECKEYTENIIDVSNDIIVYNLIEKLEESSNN